MFKHVHLVWVLVLCMCFALSTHQTWHLHAWSFQHSKVFQFETLFPYIRGNKTNHFNMLASFEFSTSVNNRITVHPEPLCSVGGHSYPCCLMSVVTFVRSPIFFCPLARLLFDALTKTEKAAYTCLAQQFIYYLAIKSRRINDYMCKRASPVLDLAVAVVPLALSLAYSGFVWTYLSSISCFWWLQNVLSFQKYVKQYFALASISLF